jgi:NAD(P)-dependent dehydrogenase (short-subunit alcohol dehydrogenase family)
MGASAGRAVLVGNSDGIGLALTTRLLLAGWQVTGLSRSASSVVHDLRRPST